MSQRLLFTVAPYVAIAILALGLIRRWLRRRSEPTRRSPLIAAILRSTAWQTGFAVLALVHLLALLLPEWLLLFGRHPARLLVLEVSGFAFACLALKGLAEGVVVARRAGDPATVSAADLVFVTTLAISLMSGMAAAMLHRWASAWGASVVVPYARSVLLLAPSADAVANLPFLARLHILSGFAVLATMPFTGTARARDRRRGLERHGLPA